MGLLFAGDFLLVEVSVVEELLQPLLHFNLSFGVYKIGFIDGLLQIHIDDITSGEDMTHIDVLDKWLHCLGSLFDLGFGHAASHFPWVSCQTCNQAMCKALVAVAIVKGLDHNGLLASVTTRKQNYNFTSLCRFQNDCS